jgi:tetratricopeptide (TPR) repeat protein
MKAARLLLVALVLAASVAASAAAPAETAGGGTEPGAASRYREAIAAARSDAEKAVLHKTLGDLLAGEEKFDQAAREYAAALSLSREFPAEERLRMARVLSWGKRLDAAVSELRSLLAEDPGNTEARIHLARSLSWKGRLSEAIEEADRVLAESPGNRDALLVKANALSWARDFGASIPIYLGLLEEGEDFDARLGLAYARLREGDLKAASEERERLKPRYPYQEKEATALSAALRGAKGPGVRVGYSYYADSDENRVNRYLASAVYRTGRWTFDGRIHHADADGPPGDAALSAVRIGAFTNLTRSFGIGGGAGLARVENGESHVFGTWDMRTEIRIAGATAGVAASREVLDATAEILRNRIRFLSLAAFLEYPLLRRLTVRAQYAYRDYSDENASDDLALSVRYAFDRTSPSVGVGYRFRYLDFDRQSGSGYFDPSGFTSHQGFATLYAEKGRWHVYLEPFFGHQSFDRFGTKKEEWFGGGNLAAGLRITRDVSLEVHGEGGNYALGTAAGFNYYLVGARIVLGL